MGREVFNDFNAEDAVDERVGKTKKFSFRKIEDDEEGFRGEDDDRLFRERNRRQNLAFFRRGD